MCFHYFITVNFFNLSQVDELVAECLIFLSYSFPQMRTMIENIREAQRVFKGYVE